jgi:hypothetical protein
MKKITFVLFVLMFITLNYAQIAVVPVGSGTIGNPYQIADLENLYWITAPDSIVPVPDQAARWSSHYIQIADIDASSTQNWFPDGTGGYFGWLPIVQFSGNYDGDGKTISNLYMNRPIYGASGFGLFGITTQASVLSNIVMIDIDITCNGGQQSQIGGLVGFCFGTVDNCSVSGNIAGTDRTGGLVGELYYNGIISGSYSEGTVSGSSIGGLVGLNRGTILDSYSSSDLYGGGQCGGLVQYNEGTIDGCHATGAVTTNAVSSMGGGLVASNYGIVSNSHATGAVTAANSGTDSAGGLVGQNSNLISNSYASGNVTSCTAVGGLVANNSGYAAIIENSYSTGYVVNNYSWWTMTSGGLVGVNTGEIHNSYTRSNIFRNHEYGTSYIAGFVGRNNQGIVENSYSTGWVSYLNAANPTDKGFAGGVDTGGNYSMSGNYWDMDTSFQTSTAGGAEGRSTGHMTYPYAVDTYLGWDFTQTWAEDLDYSLNDGYPYLQETIINQVAMPIFQPEPGIYTEATEVTIETVTEDATILYRASINGGIWSDWQNYTEPINIPFDTQIDFEAYAERVDWEPSPIATASYTVTGTVAAPVFAPESGSYCGIMEVTIESDTEDAIVKYSTSEDAGTTWSEWEIYSEPITVSFYAEIDFKAYAEKENWLTSEITEASYIVTSTLPQHPAGEGTESNPYQIATLENLYWITAPDSIVPVPDQAARWSSHYIQIADIDAAETALWYPQDDDNLGWLPIGSNSNQFAGTYDGSYFSIDNLYINRSDKVGLFSVISQAGIVKDLILLDCAVNGYYDVGALAGKSYGNLQNISVTGTITGHERVGALLGQNMYNQVINCNSSGFVTRTGGGGIGGLVGLNRGLINESYSTAEVNGHGGLVGSNLSSGIISNSYATGNVSSGSNLTMGGLVGSNSGSIADCYAYGNIIATDPTSTSGGLVGENTYFGGVITRSYAIGNVSGKHQVGGFVGKNNGEITSSYANGIVSGSYAFWGNRVGGFVGYNNNNNNGYISDCYARGNVIRTHQTEDPGFGGFVGFNDQGVILNSFSTGSVSYTGATNPTDKGFAGGVDTGGNYSMSGNYWDMDTSNQATTAGVAEGRSTGHMTYPYAGDTYVGWDFTQTWAEDLDYSLNDGYPYLQMEVYVPQPQISVIPENFVLELNAGENIILPMIISNDGDAELIFSININGEVFTITEVQVKFSGSNSKNSLRNTVREEWLTASPLSGTIPAGEDLLIDITFDAEFLEPGNYNTDIIVINNAQEDVIVPVELTVIDTVSDPVFSPEPGIYTEPIEVIIQTTTEGATIIYRTTSDGGAWSDWQNYTEPINIPFDTQIDFEAYAEKDDWITSETVSASYIVTGTVANPTFTPEPGIYTDTIDVVIEVSEEPADMVIRARNLILSDRADNDSKKREPRLNQSRNEITIYYRTSTDGGTWTDWEVYTDPITISLDTEMDFEAYAERDDWITSETVSANYIVTGSVADPTFLPEPGLYTEETDVTIVTATEDATIMYRTSTGGGAWSDWQVYSDPITIPLDTEMDFETYAEKDDWITSETVEANYLVTGTVATPEFEPEGDVYLEAQTVSITTATTGATIEYSFDGEEWIEGDSVDIEYTTMLYARAYLENWLDSEIAEAMYYILNPPQELEAEGFAGYVHLNWQAPYSGDELILTVRNRRDNPIRTKRQSINRRDSDDLIGYNVYRQQDDEFILLNPEPITQTEYEDSDLEAGAYTYHVTAIYEQGESNPSDTSTATVNMVAIPEFSPEPGYYEEEIELIISCETEDAEIYFTLDDSEPTHESLLYTEPVMLDSTVTVKARAFKEDWLPSEIAEGLYEIEITDAEDDIIVPIVTSLGSAYPNPFNPETTIPFSLSKPQHVSIAIYNIRGQKVRELVDTEYEAGYHQIVWNGRDERGRQVSSGVYLYRFQCGEQSVVKRMLLLK